MTNKKNGPALSEPALQQPEADSELDEALAQIAQRDKHEANLRAYAALAGVCLDRIEADDGSTAWVITRTDWAMTRECRSLAEVQALLKRMGVTLP